MRSKTTHFTTGKLTHLLGRDGLEELRRQHYQRLELGLKELFASPINDLNCSLNDSSSAL